MASAIHSYSEPSPFSFLNPADRPKSLLEAIHKTFLEVQNKETPWGLYNGNSTYEMCAIAEQQMIKKQILAAYPQQKEFYVLDIGAGRFQWIESMADFLEKQTDLPPDIKVHVIGVRGEKSGGARTIHTARTCVHEIGSFKVEDIEQALKNEGLDLRNKIDFVVSRWCLCHLVDPVGTFVQIISLLRPKTGYFLFDGFQFSYNGNNLHPIAKMLQLLLDTKAPFLMQSHRIAGAINHFILNKQTDMPCPLPMRYSDSGFSFTREGDPYDWSHLNDKAWSASQAPWMTGDKKLFEYLKQNELLLDSTTCCLPLDKEPGSEPPPSAPRDNFRVIIPPKQSPDSSSKKGQILAAALTATVFVLNWWLAAS